MSDDDETVIVMTNMRVYHTDETCRCITDRAREWDLDEALKAGRYECGHCQADENLGSKQHVEWADEGTTVNSDGRTTLDLWECDRCGFVLEGVRL